MAITAQDVAKLRAITGAGMMDCKKALTHTDGDMDKAAEYLREQGVAIAAKKESRIASEGMVNSYTSDDGKIGALVEINCESDFVARGDEFKNLCKTVAKQVALTNPKDNDELLSSVCADTGLTVKDMINNATAKIGEKISFRRFVRCENSKEEAYIHMGGKIGVLLDVETSKDINADEGFVAMCHDVAMHIAAFSPRYVCNCQVPEDEVQHELEILRVQAMNDPKNANKPAQVVEKMLSGRIGKFYKEICLIEQDFAKDPSITVKQLVEQNAARTGAEINIKGFTRFVMGEGLEKKNENLADEVAKMQGK